ncbi:PP2C family protein-serine/threonine phosphatase [Nocardiopsis ganjiahuensis]|uniref:PP2C family protein-serine/threonine phosphatase n=1 Tax=Nocardiopsis ganjiahuensis TaxID=239984 RepID=UPI000594E7E1|nr:protein phosphatase 2C domain-containing protein [Nocardiopsis ganjiahuensis]
MNRSPGCVACEGTVAPDGHCWDCGADQPDFRLRMEVTGPGGAAGVSDRGLRRGVNADALTVVDAGGARGPETSGNTRAWTVGVVCDGVSMSPRAERAAQLAVEVGGAALAERLTAGDLPETALCRSVARAGQAVAALAGTEPTAPACTYVAGAVGPEGLWVAWVGDSRAYWLPERGGPALPLTEDDAGEFGAISAWLGADAEPGEPGVRSLRPTGPGALLLCTDGLTRYLPAAEDLRAAIPHPWPRNSFLPAARGLVGHALDRGGHDNVTALLLPVGTRCP